MLGYLKGRIKDISPEEVLIVGENVGYWVKVSDMTNLEQGKEIELYMYSLIKNENIVLYGFKSKEEMDTFKSLIAVNSIGPSLAMRLLGLGVGRLMEAIQKQDLAVLSTVSGLGKKRASRLIVDFKGVVPDLQGNDELESALKNLGYSRDEIRKVIPSVKKGNLEIMIKDALKYL